MYLTTESFGWLCWGSDAAFLDSTPSSLCPECCPPLSVTSLRTLDLEAREIQLETKGDIHGNSSPWPLALSSSLYDLNKGRKWMEWFPCETESLGVRLGLVPGGIVWESMENADENKMYFEAHVWDGAWQKITSSTSAWKTATLWPSEIYIVFVGNFFGSHNFFGIYIKDTFSSGKSKFPPCIHWLFLFYLFKNILSSSYCGLRSCYRSQNRDQDKKLLIFYREEETIFFP